MTPAPAPILRSTISLGRQWVIGFTWVALCLGSERVWTGAGGTTGVFGTVQTVQDPKNTKNGQAKAAQLEVLRGDFMTFFLTFLDWCGAPNVLFFHGKVLLNAVWKPKSPETYHKSMMWMGHHPLLNPYVPILEKQTTGTWTWYVSEKESTGSHLSVFAWGCTASEFDIADWWNIAPYHPQDWYICLLGTLQGTNISSQKWHFEDDFPFPKVGYVNSQEGKSHQKSTLNELFVFFFFVVHLSKKNWNFPSNSLDCVKLAECCHQLHSSSHPTKDVRGVPYGNCRTFAMLG